METKKSMAEQLKDEVNSNSSSNRNKEQSKIAKENKLKKYYKPTSDEETIRLIPFADGSPFKVVHFHKTKINGKVKEVLCLNNKEFEGYYDSCPFCEEAKKLRQTLPHAYSSELTEEQKLENKPILEKIYAHEPIKYVVFRVLDRGAMKDGVKFWKIKINKKIEEGQVAKILKLDEKILKETGFNICDMENGWDIIIHSDEKSLPMNQTVKYREITLVQKKEQTKVTMSPAEFELEWTDLYSVSKAKDVTPVEFLELALIEKAPYWIESEKKWVYPSEGITKIKSTIVSDSISTNSLNYSDCIDYDDDLPF